MVGQSSVSNDRHWFSDWQNISPPKLSSVVTILYFFVFVFDSLSWLVCMLSKRSLFIHWRCHRDSCNFPTAFFWRISRFHQPFLTQISKSLTLKSAYGMHLCTFLLNPTSLSLFLPYTWAAFCRNFALKGIIYHSTLVWGAINMYVALARVCLHLSGSVLHLGQWRHSTSKAQTFSDFKCTWKVGGSTSISWCFWPECCLHDTCHSVRLWFVSAFCVLVLEQCIIYIPESNISFICFKLIALYFL